MSGTATVIVISPDIRAERRVDLHQTVRQLKDRLETVTGIPANAQLIHIYDSEDSTSGAPSAVLTHDDKLVGYFGVRQGQVLQVSDASGKSLAGQFTDVSQVEKFELSDQEYARRQDTVLSYKQRHKLGRFAEHLEVSPSASAALPPIPLGARVEIDHGAGDEGIKKRGTVRFVGQTKFGTGAGVWVGVEYDEPVGRNDGSVQGERYFTCKPSYGGFVRPEIVRVGDFAPLELDWDEELEI